MTLGAEELRRKAEQDDLVKQLALENEQRIKQQEKQRKRDEELRRKIYEELQKKKE